MVERGINRHRNHDFTMSVTRSQFVGKTITSSDRLDVMYFALESARVPQDSGYSKT